MALGQGLQFPGTLISILVVSPQSEQAVVTSTLLLFRNLGMVLGVATSSLVVQNALRHYLDEFVHGDERAQVVERVRLSVQAVAELEQPYRDQAVHSYESSLRVMFLYGLALSAMAVVILVPVKLPRLRGVTV